MTDNTVYVVRNVYDISVCEDRDVAEALCDDEHGQILERDVIGRELARRDNLIDGD